MLSPSHLEHLGGTLQDLRGASGCTQAEVCARTGLKAPQLSRWENGREVPTLESLIRYLGAVGAGLADLERLLLGVEAADRRKEITRALREVYSDHRRYLRSEQAVRLAFVRIARPNPGGLERRWLDLLEGEAEAAADEPADDAPVGVPAAEAACEDRAADDPPPDGELERLLAGLPETLERLLDRPAHRRPAVVERLIDRGWALLEASDDRAFDVADAARLAAGELPAGFGRDRCFALRGRGLELWGMALRAKGEPVTAEAALLGAFGLMAQTPDAEPAALAEILGRLALVAADRGHPEAVELYAGGAARVARASDREWPMPAFVRLWRAVTSGLDAPESVARASRAVFDAMRRTYDGLEEDMLEPAPGMG